MRSRRYWLAALRKTARPPSVSKAAYHGAKRRYERELSALQREATARRVPAMIVVEGRDAAGKGRLINELILALDPRGFRVFNSRSFPADAADRPYPLLKPFAASTPARGRIAVFDRSWTFRAVDGRVRGRLSKRTFTDAIEDIAAFERQWVDDGGVIVKLFVHISKKEQRKRFRARMKDESTAWRVTAADRWRHRHYKEYREVTAELMDATDVPAAPWTLVDAHEFQHAVLVAFRTVIRTFRAAMRPDVRRSARFAPPPLPARAAPPSLARTDLTATMTQANYDFKLERRQRRLHDLGQAAWKAGLPVALIFEGWDAAGKGGVIRRLTSRMDPRGYEVVPISAPTDEEKAHHYLWRFWTRMPDAGRIVIFDRSWYGRVLVERVEGFCREDEWRRAYREIAEMERHLVRTGVLLLKFWLHIDPAAQLQRFRERETVSYKRWKITPEDWRNRDRWDQYGAAVDAMLAQTHAPWAPWNVVAFDCKWHGRIRIMDTVIEALEKRLD